METSQPNFTVSKRGVVHLPGRGGSVVPWDLPALLSIRHAAVNDLQLEFPELSIWLVNENIHVWNRGREFVAHWADVDLIRSYCQ